MALSQAIKGHQSQQQKHQEKTEKFKKALEDLKNSSVEQASQKVTSGTDYEYVPEEVIIIEEGLYEDKKWKLKYSLVNGHRKYVLKTDFDKEQYRRMFEEMMPVHVKEKHYPLTKAVVNFCSLVTGVVATKTSLLFDPYGEIKETLETNSKVFQENLQKKQEENRNIRNGNF
jgi:hypothetical protein